MSELLATPHAVLPLAAGRRDEFAATLRAENSPVGAYRLPVFPPAPDSPMVGEITAHLEGDTVLIRNARGERLRLDLSEALARLRLAPEDQADLQDGVPVILMERAGVFAGLPTNRAQRFGTPRGARFITRDGQRVEDAEGATVFEQPGSPLVALDYIRRLAMEGRMVAGLYLLTEDAGALEVDVAALPRLAWRSPCPEDLSLLLERMGLGRWSIQSSGLRTTLRREVGHTVIEAEISNFTRVRAFGTIPYTFSGETAGRSFGELPYLEREASVAWDDPEAAAALVIGQLRLPGLSPMGGPGKAAYALHLPGSDTPLTLAVEPFAAWDGATRFVASATLGEQRQYSWTGTCAVTPRDRAALLRVAGHRLTTLTPESLFRHHWCMPSTDPLNLHPLVAADLERRVRMLQALGLAVAESAA